MFLQKLWNLVLNYKPVFPILALLMIFLLSGCTQKTETLKFATWGSKSEMAILKPLLADFQNKNPDIKIELIHAPQDYFQKIHILFASNLAPDVLFINNLNLPIYANAGVLEDLTPYFDISTFFKQSILDYNGKVYAIPRDISNLVIYYNKDIFDKMNISYPKSNWTFDEFLQTSKKLSNNEHFAISFEEMSMFYLPYLMSEGGGILSDDLKTITINTKESQKGLNFYNDLRNKYNVAPKKSQSASATMTQLFIQQKLAMCLSGRWIVPKLRTDANFNWDIINFPTGTVGSIVAMDASGWAISKQSKQKQKAIRLIEFLASSDNIEKITASGLIVPARIDVAQSEAFLDKKKSPKNSQIFIDIIKTSKKTPINKDYKKIQDKIDKDLDYLFNK